MQFTERKLKPSDWNLNQQNFELIFLTLESLTRELRVMKRGKELKFYLNMKFGYESERKRECCSR